MLLGMGFSLWAWLEARVVLRKECKLKHDDVDAQLTARHDAIKELRGELKPLVVEVAKLSSRVNDMHEEVKILNSHMANRPCQIGKKGC